MSKDLNLQSYLTRLMLLEKENRELKSELDKKQDCGSSKEKLIIDSRSKYEYLLSSQLESAVVIDMESRPPVVTDCNMRATDLLNISRKEIIGREVLDFIPSNQKTYFLDNLHQVKTFRKHHFELFRFDEHREKQIFDVTGYSLTHENKEVIILRFRDVTYRNELLQENPEDTIEETSGQSLQNYPIFTFYFQFNGEGFNLARAENEAGELVYKELVHKNAEEIFPGRRDLVIDMKQCLREGLRFGKESFFKGFFSENVIYASFQFSYMQPDYVVLNIYDLTRQKAMHQELEVAKRKAEQSEQIKTAFLNNISAELRTPLNAVNGFAQLIALESGAMNSQLLQYCNQISNNTKQVLNMINDIMELARIESGDLKVVYSGIYLNKLIDDIAYKYERITSEHEINTPEIHTFKDLSDGEDLFDTDPDRLLQILENLIDNAIRFTEQGVVSFGYERHNGHFLFFVEDTGVGIPEEDLPRIFTRFYKADNQSLLGEPGVGLGLSIAQHLAQNMGSEGIQVKSKVGRGSRFWFEIPG